MKNVIYTGAVCATLALVLSACSEEQKELASTTIDEATSVMEETMDAAGETMESTMDAAGETMESTVDAAGESMDEAGDAIDEAADAAADVIDDAVDASHELLMSDKAINKVIHLGNENEITIEKMALKILKILNIKEDLILQDAPEGSVSRRCPDITLMKSIINYAPKISLNDGLKKTLMEYK